AGYWLEIKPAAPTKGECDRLLELTAFTGHHSFLLAGTVGFGEFRVYKAFCVRSMRAFDELLRNDFLGADRGLIPNRNPRLNVAGDIHPEDRPAFWHERVDLEAFEFPFCELCLLVPKHRHRRGLFLDAYAAARSARFEHGECGPK